MNNLNINKKGFRPLTVDLDKCNEIACQNILKFGEKEVLCGSIHFTQAFVIKVISPLMSSTGQNQLHPVQTFLCSRCGLPIGVVPQKKGEKEDDKKTTETDNIPI